MKITRTVSILSLLILSACSTTKAPSKSDKPETVAVIYHVRPGAETDFLEALTHAWEIYRSEHLVYAEPHVVIRENENGDKSRVVEIFTWVSHDAPNKAPLSVKEIWKREHSFCEDRNGQNGIAGGEVELLLPPNK